MKLTSQYGNQITRGEFGQSLVSGEFESASLFYSISPKYVVRPVAYGKCSYEPDTYFYLSDFHELLDGQPDVGLFCTMAAELHKKSAAMFESNKCSVPIHGKFGFHVTTHVGMFPQDNRWCNTWESFFAQGMRHILESASKIHGTSEELRTLVTGVIEKVVPRLLKPLETGGRSIRPTLIHGDFHRDNAKLIP